MSTSEGIKRFGDDAIEALSKEYWQLDNLTVSATKDATQLTTEKKKAAFNAIDLILEKSRVGQWQTEENNVHASKSMTQHHKHCLSRAS